MARREQPCANVNREIRDIADDQARYSVVGRNHSDVAQGGGQNARLSPRQSLVAPGVLDAQGLPYVADRQTAPTIKRLKVRLAQRPTFQGEMWAGASDR